MGSCWYEGVNRWIQEMNTPCINRKGKRCRHNSVMKVSIQSSCLKRPGHLLEVWSTCLLTSWDWKALNRVIPWLCLWDWKTCPECGRHHPTSQGPRLAQVGSFSVSCWQWRERFPLPCISHWDVQLHPGPSAIESSDCELRTQKLWAERNSLFSCVAWGFCNGNC